MKTFSFTVFLVLFFFCLSCHAQRVQSLVPGVYVDSILKVKPNATKIAREPISGNLFYSTVNGNIYEVYIPVSGSATDSLKYSFSDHGISYLQGLFFKDSILYLCGNNWSSTSAIGKVVKGILHANGTRSWIDMVTTNPYPTASNSGDHGFAGVNVDPSGNYIYVSSGARTHLGEVRTNGGVWPGCREVPITTRIFKFPVSTVGLILQNDSAWIDNSTYIFSWGTRNAYDMAWNADSLLFAIDNSGERDDPEELNWLRYGKNYGYPWRMGSNNNPLRFSPYNVNLDPLVNHLCNGYIAGWFANDPAFPAVPSGVNFTDPIRNYGTEADFYRDALTGQVKNASDEGSFITTFTPHRSPIGLVIDKDSVLASPYRGNGFILSFMPGGDSTGYTPLSPWGSPCPFVDHSRELIQLNLNYDAGIDNFTMTTSNVATGFYLPVDAELVTNFLYVIENSGSLWKVTFPSFIGITPLNQFKNVKIYPNPFNQNTTFEFENTKNEKYSVKLFSVFGENVYTSHSTTSTNIVLPKLGLAPGIYSYQLIKNNIPTAQGKIEIQ